MDNIYQQYINVEKSDNITIVQTQNIYTEFKLKEEYPIRYCNQTFLEKETSTYFTLLAIWNISKFNIAKRDIEVDYPLTVFFEDITVSNVEIVKNTERNNFTTTFSDNKLILSFNIFEREDFVIIKIRHADVIIKSLLMMVIDFHTMTSPAPVFGCIKKVDCLLTYKGKPASDEVFYSNKPGTFFANLFYVIFLLPVFWSFVSLSLSLFGSYFSGIEDPYFSGILVVDMALSFGFLSVIHNFIKALFKPSWRTEFEIKFKECGGIKFEDRYRWQLELLM